MKIPRIVNAIGHIEDDLVAAAESKKKTIRNPWLKWGSFAACFAVLVIAGAAILPSFFGGDVVNPSRTDSKYKFSISVTDAVVEWPWEYKTVSEKYTYVKFNGKEYISRVRSIDVELLGEVLGTCEAEGVDPYTDKKYTEKFDVRKINGVSEEKLVAIGKDDEFYVYMLDDSTKPATFGEVLDFYGLTDTLEFGHFTKYEGYDEKGYFIINDDAYIWQILSQCRDAKLYNETDSFDRSNRSYLSFTATSDALGVYKKVFYVFKDGYVATNIFNYS